MKRKFSFNLAPVKVTTKTDVKPTPEPTPLQYSGQLQSHRRHESKDSITDYSPYINRRVLDPHTELELRLACQLILQDFKPSDYGMEDTDPKLDFGALQRPREHRTKERNTQRAEAPKVRLPTGAPVDLKAALEARGLQQTELTLNAAPVRANSSRKRSDYAWLDDRDEKREANLRKSSSQRRKDHQADDPAAIAHAAAAEWMFQERQKQPFEPLDPRARPSTAIRPPSRARSIRESVKEYVFPGTTSRSLSRAQSSESLRTMNTVVSQDSSQPAGWRSWGLPRRLSSRSNSRPGTSRGQSTDLDQLKKPDASVVNLNRELPPLPSLDSWRDPASVQPKPQLERVRSPKSPAHIASLMRPQEQQQKQQQQQRAAAPPKSHRRSGSDTLATQFNAAHAARSPSYTKSQGETMNRPNTISPESPLTAIENMTLNGMTSASNRGHARHKSTGTLSTHSEAANFSRKMSVDTPSRSTFSHETKTARKEEQKSRLKRVFSGWMRKKETKDDWMQKIEKQGVKEGVMVQEGAASAPVVRY